LSKTAVACRATAEDRHNSRKQFGGRLVRHHNPILWNWFAGTRRPWPTHPTAESPEHGLPPAIAGQKYIARPRRSFRRDWNEG
jgi:hypothetical protein